MFSPETFNIIVLSWIGIAFVIFILLFKITAPYGRRSNKKWGPTINNRLGWVIMEFPALALFGYLVISGGGLRDNVIVVAFSLWMIHYINRTFIFPLRLRTKQKKMPLAIVAFAFFFNLVNGFVNGYWFGTLSPGYPADWFYDPRFIIGIVLFATGWFINQYHDNLLINLRKKSGKSGYQIPHGGLFKYISTPNFFGEIVEWGGFALLTWCLPSLSFFIWTFVNLVPRAIDHHRWYKKQFKDYPAKRKAIFPFLF